METRIRIKRRNGKVLHGKLFECYQNPSEKPPIVITCHGFPGTRDEGGRFPALAKRLNEAGIDMITFDFAGYAENEREPIFLTKQIENLEGVVDYIKKLGYNSYGTVGLSFGGQTALVTKLPDRKAAVFWAPAFYLSKVAGVFGKLFAKFWMKVVRKPLRIGNYHYEKVIMGEEFANDMFTMTPDVIDNYLSNLILPTLILQGTTDPLVRPSLTKTAFEKLPQDTDHQLKLVERAGHDFRDEKLDEFLSYTVDWFKKYL